MWIKMEIFILMLKCYRFILSHRSLLCPPQVECILFRNARAYRHKLLTDEGVEAYAMARFVHGVEVRVGIGRVFVYMWVLTFRPPILPEEENRPHANSGQKCHRCRATESGRQGTFSASLLRFNLSLRGCCLAASRQRTLSLPAVM